MYSDVGPMIPATPSLFPVPRDMAKWAFVRDFTPAAFFYAGYVVAWAFLLDWWRPKQPDPWNPFGIQLAILLGVVVAIWTTASIYQKGDRVPRVTRVLSRFSSLIETIFSNASPYPGLALAYRPNGPAAPETYVHMRDAVRELAATVLLSGVLYEWQLTNADKSAEAAVNIVAVLSAADEGDTGNIPSMFKAEVDISGEAIYSLALLNVARRRAAAMATDTRIAAGDAAAPPGTQMLREETEVAARFTEVHTAIEEMAMLDRLGAFKGAAWMLRWLGIVYFIVLPPITWLGQGFYIIASNIGAFLSVGVLVSYDVYLGDVFISPTTVHMNVCYEHLLRIARSAQNRLRYWVDGLEGPGAGERVRDISVVVTRWFPPSVALSHAPRPLSSSSSSSSSSASSSLHPFPTSSKLH